MVYDFIIKNGTVIDPYRNINEEKMDIYVFEGKIMPQPSDREVKGKQVIDASGCYVFPGLIENHAHLFYKGTDTGINGEVTLLPSGVTSGIDQGSAGISNIEAFHNNIMCNSDLDIYAYINISNMGMPTEFYFENLDPKYFRKEQIKYMLERYSDRLLGIKIRLQKESVEDLGIAPLEKTIEIADELGVPVSVHVRDIPFPKGDVAKLLRKGDTWVHIYNPKGESIFTDNAEVKKEFLKAKERGVLFDVANGRSGFSFEIARRAVAGGLIPDFIGTDNVFYNNFERPLFSLPYTMSLYLSTGLFSLYEIIEKVTVNPAATTPQNGNIGTLKENTIADIGIFKLKEKDIIFKDKHGGEIEGDRLLVPQMTIKSGKVIYRNIEF